MAQTAYPTASTLQEFVSDALGASTRQISLIIADLDFTTAAAAARRNFEEATNRIFLATTSTQKRFDPPVNSPILLLKRDLASVSDVAYTPNDGTTTTYTAGDDYVLEPVNAEGEGRPYYGIWFARWKWGGPVSISQRGSMYVTGYWGWGKDTGSGNVGFPDDVYWAMHARGASLLWPQFAARRSGGLLSFKDQDVNQDWGVSPYGHMKQEWDAQYKSAVANYRRVGL